MNGVTRLMSVAREQRDSSSGDSARTVQTVQTVPVMVRRLQGYLLMT